MMSDYVIVSIKLCPEVENDDYIIVCNFGGLRMSSFEVIEGEGGGGGVLRGPHVRRKWKKKSGLNRVNIPLLWVHVHVYLRSARKAVVVYIQDQGCFNSFADNIGMAHKFGLLCKPP